jgi:hypothetical protein
MKKIPKNLKIGTKIEIKWRDHYHRYGWLDKTDVQGEQVICFSVGYFLGHDDTYLYMSATDSPNQYAGLMARLKNNILALRKLKP